MPRSRRPMRHLLPPRHEARDAHRVGRAVPPVAGTVVPCRRRWQGNEAGFNLIEVIMTVAILGIAVVAVLSGLLTAANASDFQRKDAVVETALRNYAENIRTAALASCTQNATGQTFTALNPDNYPVTYPELARYGITLTANPIPTNLACPPSTSSTAILLGASSADGRLGGAAYQVTVVVSVP
jgi:prepilin-type N-terminal cleavage/methylation domain-containing protein